MINIVSTVILFLVSLLAVLPAPAFYLWLLAIAVDEYPWIFVLLTLAIIVVNLKSKTFPLATAAISLISVLLFLSTNVRAYFIGRDLESELTAAFGAFDPDIDSPYAPTRQLAGNIRVPYNPMGYKKNGAKTLILNFYPAQKKGDRPCVVVIHGGSWKSGDNQQLPELNEYLALKGYHVAAINYRLAPDFQSPAPVEDVADALFFLKNKATELNIDTTNFIILGRSAGAQIALLSAYTLHDPAIKGVIDFYGPADMVWGYSLPSNPLIMDSRKVMEDYLGGTYQAHPENYKRSSPLLFVSDHSPPTLLIHGKNDVLVAYEHSQRLNIKLEEHKIKHYLLTIPWATHAFDYNLNGPGGQLSTYAVMYFLKSVTQHS
ncbi:Acetyl esterase/lipase [Dyadobacter koreensis]|uniref:Acetyl esterase/lipase n=1 Tax=Dyadobacter koreensis TaxID=408657 RepID=A0A1H6UVA9_9BACT|nr:alpha/beta hydrolase [Dyadobacter koreensis]SEI96198.1 Acetyl esterase/lipase [Dyadobacter koreensis]